MHLIHDMPIRCTDDRVEKQRGTSLALSRFFFRFVIPAHIPPTDSDRIIAKSKQQCRNAYLRKSTNTLETQNKTANIYETLRANINEHAESQKCGNAEIQICENLRTSSKLKTKQRINIYKTLRANTKEHAESA